MKLRKDLSKPGLLRAVRACFDRVPDTVVSRKYSLGDCLMAGLAVFMEKSPSLLQFQNDRLAPEIDANLRQLYGLGDPMCDTTLRTRLDPIRPGLRSLRRCFREALVHAQRGGELKRMQIGRGYYVVAIDGTQSFSSSRIHGPCCLEARRRNGRTTFSHQQLCAVMVRPERSRVLPMAIEAIRNGDGSSKNDCERNAFGRLLPEFARMYAKMKMKCIIVADGLYSHAPQIQLLKRHGLNFLLTARPADHQRLYSQMESSRQEWVEDLTPEGQSRKRRVRILQNLSLNKSHPDLRVHVVQSEERRSPNSEDLLRYAWVTNLDPEEWSPLDLARAARSRWKIENETFNTLKTFQSFEHNFGHGKRHLSDLLAMLMLLAFLIDQLLESACPAMKRMFILYKSRKDTWNRLRSLFCCVPFSDWGTLYACALREIRVAPPILDTS